MNLHASNENRCCVVVELRQYTLKPGQRDVLVEIFDRHLVEAQESLGATGRSRRSMTGQMEGGWSVPRRPPKRSSM